MTPVVVTIAPDASVMDAARLLLEHRISAVPVVDAGGLPVGMVSEGDLLGRDAAGRLAGHEWWLMALSGPAQAEAGVMEAAMARLVREVMQAPVVTVAADTPVHAVADLLRSRGIKRVPVMQGNRMAGIVARADLLRVVEAMPPGPAVEQQTGVAAMLMGLFGGAAHPAGAVDQRQPAAAPAPAPATAGAFRRLAEASHQGELDGRAAAVQAAEQGRAHQVEAMLQEHVSTELWNTLMARAETAAAHGAKEMRLLGFPSGLCSDSGRKINNADPAWAETLRGEAADVYSRWERDMKPAGFSIAARVLAYLDGRPGDIGLFLVWEN